MTREEILAMPAGRELDALVAEKVMGESMPIYIHPHDDIFKVIYSEKGNWYCSPEYDKGDVCEWQPRRFSQEINFAWEVVVKMENNDFWWTAEDVIPNSDPVVYSCTFSKGGKYYTAEWEFSLPLAICRAALLAVMGL